MSMKILSSVHPTIFFYCSGENGFIVHRYNLYLIQSYTQKKIPFIFTLFYKNSRDLASCQIFV